MLKLELGKLLLIFGSRYLIDDDHLGSQGLLDRSAAVELQPFERRGMMQREEVAGAEWISSFVVHKCSILFVIVFSVCLNR